MLGSEYTWLISFNRPTDGAPRVSLARSGLLTLVVAVFGFLCVALHGEPPHLLLLREAGAAAKAGDTAGFITKLEAARTLRPDYPRVLYSLARGYTAAGRPDDALAALRELAAMGLNFDVAHDPALAALRDVPGFAALTQALSPRESPATGDRDETAWVITDVDGIIEGLACHPATLQWYFSDVHNRCVWFRDISTGVGLLKKFSSEATPLLGVFGLKIDEAHNTLWAGTAAVPEMKGYTAADKGRAELVAFDLATGRVRHAFAVPADGREHVLGDVLLAPDGGVFTSDSVAPVIWRLAPGGARLEKWLEGDDFVSLQGMAFSPDGRDLIVADYANGLWRVNLASRAVALLPAPAHTTLFGIDGLYAAPDGLVAVQNGVNPQRIIRLALRPDGRPAGVRVLLAGLPAMSDVALGQVVAGRLQFIGNSGWSLYENPLATPAARAVTILSTPL